jgi:octaprenyl-diphosphate synthase
MSPDLALSTLRTSASHSEPRAFDAHIEALRSFLGGQLEAVESELPEVLGGSLHELVDSSRHLLTAGGKRIRPILTLLCAGTVGLSGANVRKLACAGELVHLASLLHDDVIDNADVRRGVATPRVVWTNTTSVLSGDYALTRALDLVGGLPSPGPLMEAVTTLRLLVEGEIIQLRHRGQGTMTREDYQAVIERKTASLFSWCCRSGALLSATPDFAEPLGRFGNRLGNCFQIVDDVLDFSADQASTGKEPFTDLCDGKLTLPVLIALDQHPEFRAPLVAMLRANTDEAGRGSASARAFLPDFVRTLERSGALDQARALAVQAAEQAIDALHEVPASAHRDALETIARALATRMR